MNISRYANGYSRPRVDNEQDVTPISGQYNNGVLTIEVSERNNKCPPRLSVRNNKCPPRLSVRLASRKNAVAK